MGCRYVIRLAGISSEIIQEISRTNELVPAPDDRMVGTCLVNQEFALPLVSRPGEGWRERHPVDAHGDIHAGKLTECGEKIGDIDHKVAARSGSQRRAARDHCRPTNHERHADPSFPDAAFASP